MAISCSGVTLNDSKRFSPPGAEVSSRVAIALSCQQPSKNENHKSLVISYIKLDIYTFPAIVLVLCLLKVLKKRVLIIK